MPNELAFVQRKITECPHNESSWNYLRGLLKMPAVTQLPGVLDKVADTALQVRQRTMRVTNYCTMDIRAPLQTLQPIVSLGYVLDLTPRRVTASINS